MTGREGVGRNREEWVSEEKWREREERVETREEFFFNLYVPREDFAELACSFSATPSLTLMQLNTFTPGSCPVQPQSTADCRATPREKLGSFVHCSRASQ